MDEEYVTVNKKDYDEILFQWKAWKNECERLRLERDKFKRMVENSQKKAREEILASGE